MAALLTSSKSGHEGHQEFWSLGRCRQLMALSSPTSEASTATVLWPTSDLPRLEKRAPVPARREIRQGTQAQRVAQRRLLVTLLIFPGSGHDVCRGCDVVAAVNVVERSNLSCTRISVAQWRHQRKPTDVTSCRKVGSLQEVNAPTRCAAYGNRVVQKCPHRWCETAFSSPTSVQGNSLACARKW